MLRKVFIVAAGIFVFELAPNASLDQSALASDDPSSLSEPVATASEAARFVAPAAASMIVLPGTASATHAAAADEAAAQQALLRRASREAEAAAAVRRKAEDLSRRFVAEDGVATGESVAIEPAMNGDVPVAATSMAAVTAPPDAQPTARITDPQDSDARDRATAIITTADPLVAARRQAAEAEQRAAAERSARLAAEASAGAAMEQAAEALARARTEAEAASRRAAAAEARALKVTREAQRQLAKAAAVTASADKQRSASRVQSASGKRDAVQPAGANGKPGVLTTVPKFALGATAAVTAPVQPRNEPPSKWSPPSPPGLFGLVPSFAK